MGELMKYEGSEEAVVQVDVHCTLEIPLWEDILDEDDDGKLTHEQVVAAIKAVVAGDAERYITEFEIDGPEVDVGEIIV